MGLSGKDLKAAGCWKTRGFVDESVGGVEGASLQSTLELGVA